MPQSPSPRRKPQLSDRAAEHVRALIMSGTLRPGEIVRPESIGASLQISTTPAREALQTLRAEGFLTLQPGAGFRVDELTGDDVRDLFRVQALIAGELAARAAENGTESETAELEALHFEMSAAGSRNDMALLEDRNDAFHRQINQMARARKVKWAVSLLTRYVPREFYPSISGWADATRHDHEDIVASIKAHDAAAARSAMEQHIEHAGHLLAEHVDAWATTSPTETPTDS